MITPALCVNVLLELSLIKIKGSAALMVTQREGRSLIRGHGGVPVANMQKGSQENLSANMSGIKESHVVTYT